MTQSDLKLLFVILPAFTLSACSPNLSVTPTAQAEITALAASTSVQVTNATPSSGNALLLSSAGVATSVGSGLVRVTLSQTINDTRYDLFVYYAANSGAVSHVSLSWVQNSVLNNAFSSSPSGATVDLTNKQISLINVLLNSGLPSTAQLSGQFKYRGP